MPADMSITQDELEAILSADPIVDIPDVELEASTDASVAPEPTEIETETRADNTDALDMTERDPEAILRELEEVRHEAYSGQESTEKEIVTTAKSEKKERTPRPVFLKRSDAIRHRSGGDASLFALEIEDADLDADKLNEKMEEILSKIDAMPKKVGEKAANMFSFLKTGERLSEYTKIGLKRLIEKGSVSSKELVETMRWWPDGSMHYEEGTARSQSQQLMTLFPAMKIATKSGSVLTLNPESTIVEAFKATI